MKCLHFHALLHIVVSVMSAVNSAGYSRPCVEYFSL